MNFKKWLDLYESGTMASTPTGAVGDVAPFKAPIGFGLVRRSWPEFDKKKKSKFFVPNS